MNERTTRSNAAPGVTNADLLDLRDIVTARADDGRPIVVDDPGTEHGRALVLTLGAWIRPPKNRRSA